MRFGNFLYPTSVEASQDSQAIDNCLREVELSEELGLDAIWMAEHHFAGEVAYADPLVFGGAIAMRTKRVLLGIGVVEMALHHPVRLAVQSALLDNLSHGRLVLGTGRGSSYSAYEYAGFGTTVDEARERMDEAEDLLVKSWTTDALDYRGKYWQVRFPSVRPRPYQKPHPPLARACLTEESLMDMARRGRPVLLRGRSITHLRQQIQLYRDTMLSAGYSEEAVEQNVDRSWIWREMYLAETDYQALDEFLPGVERVMHHLNDMRQRWNPEDRPMPPNPPVTPRSAYLEEPNPDVFESLLGSPKRVAEQVAQLRDAGVRNLLLANLGVVPPEKAEKSWRLMAEKVIPLFR